MNEKCAFYHKEQQLCLLTYCDDLLITGRRQDVAWFFDVLGKRFKVKEPTYLHKDAMLDHLGMVLVEDNEGTYLTMQSYIKLMLKHLDVDVGG